MGSYRVRLGSVEKAVRMVALDEEKYPADLVQEILAQDSRVAKRLEAELQVMLEATGDSDGP